MFLLISCSDSVIIKVEFISLFCIHLKWIKSFYNILLFYFTFYFGLLVNSFSKTWSAQDFDKLLILLFPVSSNFNYYITINFLSMITCYFSYYCNVCVCNKIVFLRLHIYCLSLFLSLEMCTIVGIKFENEFCDVNIWYVMIIWLHYFYIAVSD